MAEYRVPVTSTVPAMAGEQVELYVRERGTKTVLAQGAGDKVVLFVHGAGTPAEVAFDVRIGIIAGWPIWRGPGMTCSRSI